MKKTMVFIIILSLFSGCSKEENTVKAEDMERDVAECRTTEYEIYEITKAGENILSGDMEQTQVVVNVDKEDDVTLVLDNVNISNCSSASIYVKSANNVTIELKDGTSNVLTDGLEYEVNEEENINSVIYSKSDLILSGTGYLKINSNYNDAINSNDDLTIESGNYLINTLGDAFVGSDSLLIENGLFNIITGDGSENAPVKEEEHPAKGQVPNPAEQAPDLGTEDATSTATPRQPNEEMALPDNKTVPSGETVEPSTESNDDLVSTKAFKTDGVLTINDGDFTIDSLDDSFHSNDSLVINDGTFNIMSGDDAINATTALEINGGNLDIKSSYEAIEAQTITINNGVVNVNATDDGINAVSNDANLETSIIVNDGEITISTQYDGLDSNGSIEINGGKIYGLGNTSQADTIFDFDRNTANVNGGEIIAVGVLGNNTTAFSNSSTQNSIVYQFDNVISANTKVEVLDSDGNSILEVTPTEDFQVAFISSEKLNDGETVKIVAGDFEKTITIDSNTTVTSNLVLTNQRH